MSGSDAIIDSCNFNYNNASDGSAPGAGIYLTGKNSIMNNCIFTGQKTTSNSNPEGCAFVWFGINGTITNCKFYDNYATTGDGDGGAGMIIANYGTMANCYFEGNKCIDTGSAVYSPASYWNYINCTFTKNSALNSRDNDGGALSINGINNNVINCTFTDN